jgi:hypothetical protein
MNWFTDSFSHYSTLAQILAKWNGPSGNNLVVGSAYAIGAASQGMQTQSNSAFRNLGDNISTGAFGARFRLDSTSSGTFLNFFQVLDLGTVQLTVSYNTSGQLSLYRGGGALLGSEPITLTLGTVHTIELVPVIAGGTGGSCSVYIDNVLLMTITGVSTSASGNGYFNQVSIGDPNQFKFISWADVYLNDFTGAAMNVRLGNWSILPYTVNAAGTYAEFTPGGTILGTNYQQLDKALASSASYNESTTVSNRDNFHMAPALGTLLGARQWLYAQAGGGGSRAIALTLSNFTDQIGVSQSLGSEVYGFFTADASIDPSTGAAWASIFALNASESGYIITV